MRFDPVVAHVARKNQVTADTLSRAPIGKPAESELAFIGEVEEFAKSRLRSLPATKAKLEEFKTAQDADAECSEVK